MRPNLTTPKIKKWRQKLNSKHFQSQKFYSEWKMESEENNLIFSISIHSIQPKSEHKANDKQKNKKKLTKDSNSTWVHIKDLTKETHLIRRRKGNPSNSAVPNYFIYIYIKPVPWSYHLNANYQQCIIKHQKDKAYLN